MENDDLCVDKTANRADQSFENTHRHTYTRCFRSIYFSWKKKKNKRDEP